MTDINKAIAFAKECLKFECTEAFDDDDDKSILGEKDEKVFNFEDAVDIQRTLETFLGNRFFIQINRGTTSLFKWSVIVGLQDRKSRPPLIFDHGRGDGDDLWDAIFDACVAAARLYTD